MILSLCQTVSVYLSLVVSVLSFPYREQTLCHCLAGFPLSITPFRNDHVIIATPTGFVRILNREGNSSSSQLFMPFCHMLNNYWIIIDLDWSHDNNYWHANINKIYKIQMKFYSFKLFEYIYKRCLVAYYIDRITQPNGLNAWNNLWDSNQVKHNRWLRIFKNIYYIHNYVLILVIFFSISNLAEIYSYLSFYPTY